MRHLRGVARMSAVGILVSFGSLGAQEAARTVAGMDEPTALDDRARAVHLLQRATFGPLPVEIDRVMSMGIEAWLDEQLHPERIEDGAAPVVAERFPVTVTPVSELLRDYPPQSVLQPLVRLSQDESLTEEQRQSVRGQLRSSSPNVLINELVGARLYRSAYSERQLEEMMTQFWFDHFNVFFRKNPVSYVIADFERSAIRPNVFGSFEDMLVATASHPAMLYYLDNARSVAPDSSLAADRLRQLSAQFGNIGARMGRGRGAFPGRTAGGRLRAGASYEEMLLDSLRILQQQQQQAERQRQGAGLNENYARELLELHTLGVDGGYTQDDVVAVARAFTGWGVSPPTGNGGPAIGGQRGQQAGRQGADEMREMALSGALDVDAMVAEMDFTGAHSFEFRPFLHDAKEKVVLGQVIPAGGGIEDGLAVLEMLASHPSTARFIATQLATRFVSDDPPGELVAELERVFLETDGDLREVTRTLFSHESFYAPEVVNARVKSPFTLLASAVRLTGAEIIALRPLIASLQALGEVPYMADAPIGYPEESAVWVSSGAMLNRMNLGLELASGDLRGLRIAPRRLMRGTEAGDAQTLESLAGTLLPGADTERLLATITEEVAAAGEGTARDRATTILGLILGSPEFQRH